MSRLGNLLLACGTRTAMVATMCVPVTRLCFFSWVGSALHFVSRCHARIPQLNSVIAVSGCTHALVTDWNGDNAGPYTADQYYQHFQQLQALYPNATVCARACVCCLCTSQLRCSIISFERAPQIVASTWDDFVQHLPPVMDQLPVYTQEIGDTWCVPFAVRAVGRVWEPLLSCAVQAVRCAI